MHIINLIHCNENSLNPFLWQFWCYLMIRCNIYNGHLITEDFHTDGSYNKFSFVQYFVLTWISNSILNWKFVKLYWFSFACLIFECLDEVAEFLINIGIFGQWGKEMLTPPEENKKSDVKVAPPAAKKVGISYALAKCPLAVNF